MRERLPKHAVPVEDPAVVAARMIREVTRTSVVAAEEVDSGDNPASEMTTSYRMFLAFKPSDTLLVEMAEKIFHLSGVSITGNDFQMQVPVLQQRSAPRWLWW